MTDKKLIAIGSIVVLINLLVSNLFAPTGMMLTPVIIVLLTILIGYRSGLKPITKSIVLFGLIAAHDIGIKLYSGGRHDLQGMGWIHLLLFVGLVPSYLVLVSTIVYDKRSRIEGKVIAILIFPVLIAIHLSLFDQLGIGRTYWYPWNG